MIPLQWNDVVVVCDGELSTNKRGFSEGLRFLRNFLTHCTNSSKNQPLKS